MCTGSALVHVCQPPQQLPTRLCSQQAGRAARGAGNPHQEEGGEVSSTWSRLICCTILILEEWLDKKRRWKVRVVKKETTGCDLVQPQARVTTWQERWRRDNCSNSLHLHFFLVIALAGITQLLFNLSVVYILNSGSSWQKLVRWSHDLLLWVVEVFKGRGLSHSLIFRCSLFESQSHSQKSPQVPLGFRNKEAHTMGSQHKKFSKTKSEESGYDSDTTR